MKKQVFFFLCIFSLLLALAQLGGIIFFDISGVKLLTGIMGGISMSLISAVFYGRYSKLSKDRNTKDI